MRGGVAGGVKVKNIIFMIGDGMGFAQIYAANKINIELGLPPLTLLSFPYAGVVSTYSADNFTTDSAAGATALGSGVKTNNGYIGKDPLGNNTTSILTEAKSRGLAVGMLATVSLTHATPAAFYAHNISRDNQVQMAKDFLPSDFDVSIGSGRIYFRTSGNENLLNQISGSGYTVAYGKNEILSAPTNKKLLGFVHDREIMPRIKEGRGMSLTESLEKALSMDILTENGKGFFLMVEGSQIDKGGHARNGPWMIEEMQDFDRAIKVAKDFAEKEGNTLVIVTADHETGGFVMYGKDKLQYHYTASVGGVAGGHTANPVGAFAYGPGAENFVGFFDNTEFKSKIMKLMGWQ